MPADLPTIAHVMHRMYLAGAEVLAADIARRLKDRYRFVFLCLDEIGPLGMQLAEEGFDVIDLERKPGIDWAVSKRIRRAQRRYGIDLYHAHQYTPFFYAAWSRWFNNRPCILFTEHGRHYPDYRRPKRVIVNRFLIRRHDRVTAVGHFVKQALVSHEGIAPGRIEVIHNGIDPQKFSNARNEQDRSAIRAELGIGSDQIMVLQVARFHPVKDHATAIQAMALAVQQAPKAVLVLAGDGERMAQMQGLADDLKLADHVRFLGVRQDIPRLMAGADVFLLSSLSEGISVTLLEAMGASVPIVATEVGGNSEVVIAGQSGLLSPRGDAEGLARHLVSLVNDEQMRLRMGQAGHTHLLEQFTQQQMHEAYIRNYQEMLSAS